MERVNLFDGIPRELPEEMAQTLVAGRGVRIERIVFRGHASPDGFWYNQDEDEWVLLRGGAGLEIEGERRICELAPGDALLLPARRRHRVAWTAADTIWLAVFFVAEERPGP